VKRVRIDGTELEYEVSGTGEPVVFIHGAFIADPFQPLLTEPGLIGNYQCLHYHRRGYAGSGRVTGLINVAQQAADCKALLRHVGVGRAHVVGHSYGGAVALQLALDAPDMVHSLAVLEPALMVGTSAQGYRESLTQGAERYREADAFILVDAFLEARWPAYRAALDQAVPEALAQAVADAGTWYEREVPGLLSWRFGEAEARRITQPTVSVLGGESEKLGARFSETHRLLLEWMPQAEGFVLPGTTHFLQIEDPHGSAEVLTAFWARHQLPADSA
jgi:pimeloyl-ACP methyl ester carboxylesterase